MADTIQNLIDTVICGDCLEVMKGMPDNCIDSIITDPPYGLEFMGKGWDRGVPGISYWSECLRVAKPGAILMAFGGTRTYHRLTCAIEDAGWEIRDCIQYMYGSGFPKGKNFSTDMHIHACEWYGSMVEYDHEKTRSDSKGMENPATGPTRSKQEAEYAMRFVWATYLSQAVYACAKCGQVLQPRMSEQSPSLERQAWAKSEISWAKQSSMEGRSNLEAPKRELLRCEICQMSHGLLADGAEGWLHSRASIGNGHPSWAITNQDGGCSSYRPQSIKQLYREPDAVCIEQKAQGFRGWNVCLKPSWEPIIVAMKPLDGTYAENAEKWGVAGLWIDGSRIGTDETIKVHHYDGDHSFDKGRGFMDEKETGKGRFPANTIMDESAARLLDEQCGESVSTDRVRKNNQGWGDGIKYGKGNAQDSYGFTDSGGASRFFYCAKASRAERNVGCEGLEIKGVHRYGVGIGEGSDPNAPSMDRNHHPTVKPLALMEYLCRLTKTPAGGIVLDPFAGSGTTGIAAYRTGRPYILIENEEEYVEIARARIQHERDKYPLFDIVEKGV